MVSRPKHNDNKDRRTRILMIDTILSIPGAIRRMALLLPVLLLVACGGGGNNGGDEDKGDGVVLRSLDVDLGQVVEGDPGALSVYALYSDGSRREISGEAALHIEIVNPGLAEISQSDGTLVITGKTIGTTKLTISYGELSVSIELNVLPPVAKGGELTGLAFEPAALELAAGDSAAVKVFALYSGGSRFDVSAQVQWQVAPEAPVSVTDLGIRADAPGEGQIIATFEGQSASLPVNVTPAELRGIRLAFDGRLVLGLEVSLSVTGLYSDGERALDPADLTWRSSNKDIAAVEAGRVTAKAEGAVTITAGLDGMESSLKLDAVPAAATELKVIAESLITELAKGRSHTFRTQARFEDGQSREVTASWSLVGGTPLHASITPAGELTALAADGAVKLAASYDTQTVMLDVTLLPAVLESLALVAPPAALPVGILKAITVQGTFSDGPHEENLAGQLEWVVEPAEVMEVVKEGEQTYWRGLIAGEATVSASLPGSEVSLAGVSVTVSRYKSLEVTPSSQTSKVGQRGALTIMAVPESGSATDVTAEVGCRTDSQVVVFESGCDYVASVSGSTTVVPDNTNDYKGVTQVPGEVKVDSSDVLTVDPAQLAGWSHDVAVSNRFYAAELKGLTAGVRYTLFFDHATELLSSSFNISVFAGVDKLDQVLCSNFWPAGRTTTSCTFAAGNEAVYAHIFYRGGDLEGKMRLATAAFTAPAEQPVMIEATDVSYLVLVDQEIEANLAYSDLNTIRYAISNLQKETDYVIRLTIDPADGGEQLWLWYQAKGDVVDCHGAVDVVTGEPLTASCGGVGHKPAIETDAAGNLEFQVVNYQPPLSNEIGGALSQGGARYKIEVIRLADLVP